MLTRRSMLLGLIAAPAVIRTPGLLMPIKAPLWTPAIERLPPGTYQAKLADMILQKDGVIRMIFEMNGKFAASMRIIP